MTTTHEWPDEMTTEEILAEIHALLLLLEETAYDGGLCTAAYVAGVSS